MEGTCDPLARGLCRPPMFLMAPYDAAVVNGMFSVSLCLALGQLMWLPAVMAPLHLCAVLICLAEPRAFELMHRFLVSASHGRAWQLWGGVSLTPARISGDAV